MGGRTQAANHVNMRSLEFASAAALLLLPTSIVGEAVELTDANFGAARTAHLAYCLSYTCLAHHARPRIRRPRTVCPRMLGMARLA